MDKQDQTAQQVWQRVLANRDTEARQDLRQLQRQAAELAAEYRKIATRLTGKQQEQARRLWAGEQANAAALAGLGKLTRTAGENLKQWQPGKENPPKALERCYHKTRRCLTEYLSRSAEPELGVVFEKLAKREGEHCLWIAELLGSLQ